MRLFIQYLKKKPSRVEYFNFKNKENQNLFFSKTSETTAFSDCFENDTRIEVQGEQWFKTLNNFFQQSFKKIRFTGKVKETNVSKLLDDIRDNTKSSMKKLQFGTSKCVNLHVGKTMCGDLYVDGWKLDVVTDTQSGECFRSERFGGQERMGVNEEQLYLGDIISADRRQDKNVLSRKNKSQGIINQIMEILKSVFFEKYYFEVALVLNSSLFLSSILLNSEAWVNLSDKNIRDSEKNR